jgi:DNA-binding MarR family transcriptional regulator
VADAVDEVIEQWRRVEPGLADDLWPIGVIGRISRLSRMLDRELKRFFAEHGLESGEYDVLATVHRSGRPEGLTAGSFLKAALVTSGAVTNRVDRMEAKGLVERVRDSDDRRSVKIRLTARGTEIVQRVTALHLANERRLLAALSEEQCGRLTEGLRILLESLGDTELG